MNTNRMNTNRLDNVVVSLTDRQTHETRRLSALLGQAPVLTLQPDEGDADLCYSVRLLPGDDGWWVGLVRDKSLLADRVRMGMRPSFVHHADGETPVVAGSCDARLCGRSAEPTDLGDGSLAAVAHLLRTHPFPSSDLVVLALRLVDVRIDDGESPLSGAIPRT